MAKTMVGMIAILSLASALGAQDPFAPRVLMHRSQVPASFSIARDTSPTLTVPAETEADVELLSGLHTRVTNVDDPIIARVLRPVLVDGRVAFPPGSVLDGRVTHVRAASRLHRPGELAFRFEQITLPDGESEPVSAVLTALDDPLGSKRRVDAEGHIKGARGFSWKTITGGLAAWGSLATVKFAVASTSAVASFIPATGGGLLGFELLWPRGNDVHILPETHARIRLNYPVTVRVAW
jgi:hypothetical protein